MKTIAVIGAGITGLTAAFRLQRSGFGVTVYESDGRVGGVIRSIREDGYLAEFGPNTVLETSPKIRELVTDLGLDDRRMYSDPHAENRYLVRARKTVKLPGSLRAFLSTPLFSAGAKARLLWEPFVRRAPAEREECVAEFVKRRIGQEFLDYAINPLVAGIYAGDPNKLSVLHAFPKLHEVEQRWGSLILGQVLGARERKRRAEVSKQNATKLSFDEGLEVLTQTLHARLGSAVRLNTTVTAIRSGPAGWRVSARQSGRAEPEEMDHSAVIYCGPAYRFSEIQWGGETRIDGGSLSRINHPPVASVVLGFRRSDVAHPLDGFGMLVPQVEGLNILGTLFSSSLFPNRAPSNHVTLTTYVGGTRAPELALLKPSRLVELVVNDLRKLVGVSGKTTFEHCVLYPKAIPQYEVGYGRFKQLMDAYEAGAPGFFLAGNYREGISLSDSILSGWKTAERVTQYLPREVPRQVCAAGG